MRSTTKTRLLIGASVALVALVEVPTSEAGDDKPLSCVVSGETPVEADTMIYDKGSKGEALAKLTGVEVPLTIHHFPNPLGGPLGGRVAVKTSTGEGAVRIEGWADADAFRFFAAKDIPVVGSNIWITKGQELDLTGGSAKGFKAKLKILGSPSAPKTVSVPCDAVALEMPSMPSSGPPERARTYQMKSDSIELYDGPGGSHIYTLQMEEGTRKVFWSTETRQGFVHIVSRADITIDAWARYRDLTWTRHAELMDLAAVAPKPFRKRKLAIQDPPEVMVAKAEIPIHDEAANRPKPIGFVEKGARFYPMEVSGDWTNIMPETLSVLPPDDGGFWVRTASLPK